MITSSVRNSAGTTYIESRNLEANAANEEENSEGKLGGIIRCDY